MRRVATPDSKEVWIDPDTKIGLLNTLFDLRSQDHLFIFYFKEDNPKHRWGRYKGLVKIGANYSSNQKPVFMIAATRTQNKYRWEVLHFTDQIVKIAHSAKSAGGVVYDVTNDNSEHVGERY